MSIQISFLICIMRDRFSHRLYTLHSLGRQDYRSQSPLLFNIHHQKKKRRRRRCILHIGIAERERERGKLFRHRILWKIDDWLPSFKFFTSTSGHSFHLEKT